MKTSYLSIEGKFEAIHVEKASKFIAYATEINNTNSFKEVLSTIKALHPKARHHCYAYRLGMDLNNFRCDDDGEPSGTAGKPILRQIDSFDLTNVLLVVVRYFGGTLLGVAGLTKAYKTAALEVLKKSVIIERNIEHIYMIKTNESIMYKILHLVKQMGVNYKNLVLGDNASIDLELPLIVQSKFFSKLKSSIENKDPIQDLINFEIQDCEIINLSI
ncbi:MAG: YigZ family protein [Saprospiraceae bacterium]